MQASQSLVLDEIERLHRSESRAILASLIRLLGDFDVAEEAAQEAFTCALEKWPIEGVPRNPRSWLIGVGRHRGIDILRRAARLDSSLDPQLIAVGSNEKFEEALDAVSDDDLRLVFTCCHPALSPEARVALTLREVCGLSTEEIARAFLCQPSTIAQRIVRAKTKIRQAAIKFEVPGAHDLPERLEAVLHVVYLVFNEGYSASFGDTLTRADLSTEAIRLGELISDLTSDSEAHGLCALMLFQESRRNARSSNTGDIVTLEHQNRELWDRDMIARGQRYLARALASGEVGPFGIQAAIAQVHAIAEAPDQTDWRQVVSLYDLLLRMNPSPVIQLNRSVAIAMSAGFEAGLAEMDEILATGLLSEYALLHSARADILRRLERHSEAAVAYRKAIELSHQGPQQRFLEARLAACLLA